MRAHACAILLLSLAAPLLGCMMKPVPLSAQAGATAAIPLNGRNGAGEVGYAGLAVEDAQRGELVYSLETSNGPVELVTRSTTVAGPGTTTPLARGDSAELFQVVSFVDIPADAPLGTYDVTVKRRFTDPDTGTVTEEDIHYKFELSILPNQIDVVRADGTTETVTGRPTPFQRCCGLNGQLLDITNAVPRATPDPAVHISLDASVWAVELQVDYPPGVIDVVDALESPIQRLNDRAAIWVQDDGSGSLTLKAVATHRAFDRVELAFALDDPTAALLDPADVSVSVLGAWDRDGVETTVVPSVAGIF